MIGAARLKCGKPAAEAGELIWRQIGNSFGDFLDFHVALFVGEVKDLVGAHVCFRPEYPRPPALLARIA